MNETDQKVVALQQKVEEKKAAISKAERPKYLTNSVFRESESGPPINIQTAGKTAEIVRLLAIIVEKETAFEAANQILGTKEIFSWCGYKVADWEADFKTRLSVISIAEEKQKLKKMEQMLESLESTELKTKKTLAEIEAALKE